MVNRDIELFESPISKKRLLIACLHYFVGYTYVYPMLLMGLWQLFTKEDSMPVALAIALTAIVLVTTVIMLWPVYKESWLEFIKDPITNIGYVIIYIVALFIINIVLSLIIMLLTGLDNSANQLAIEEMFFKYPFYISFSAVVFAPIVEEGIFRGGFFRWFSSKNMIQAYVISSFLFGFLHVYESVFTGNFLDIAFVIVYGGMGVVFANLYHRTDQMISGILLHALYNGISIMLLMML